MLIKKGTNFIGHFYKTDRENTKSNKMLVSSSIRKETGQKGIKKGLTILNISFINMPISTQYSIY